MFNIPPDPKLQKELAEEHQREILEDVEAERLAHGDIPAGEGENLADEEYQPVTEEKDGFVPAHHKNRHIHDDK